MSSIKCGKCRGTHESVQEVRSCYAGQKTAAPAPTFRANRYAGPCALCGATVEPEAGRILPKDGGQNGYDVLHLAGQCSSVPVKRVAGPTARDFSAVRGGYYATIAASGRNDFDFWYVKEGRKPGYRFVLLPLGGHGRPDQPEPKRSARSTRSWKREWTSAATASRTSTSAAVTAAFRLRTRLAARSGVVRSAGVSNPRDGEPGALAAPGSLAYNCLRRKAR